jgi:cyclopropane fatty-acyl-phospholipid synthase-like methyltransferase
MSLAFSAAAERNKTVIADALLPWLDGVESVLELGSGTGQHVAYFAARYPEIEWQPSDRPENLISIDERVRQAGLSNVKPVIALDVAAPALPDRHYDFVFSANTAHIMSEAQVTDMFSVVATCLNTGGCFALYGPFKYRGVHTAASNESFDAMLRQQAAHMGIRDKAVLDAVAFEQGLDFEKDIGLPANNRLLLWRR